MAAAKHDPHIRPPVSLRQLFKRWQKISPDALSLQQDLIDTHSLGGDIRVEEQRISITDTKIINDACAKFLAVDELVMAIQPQCFEIKSLPGLSIYPSLFPSRLQRSLLDKLLHRDLGDPNHKTNLHLHYHMPEELITPKSTMSFFDLDPGLTLWPRDPTIHKPISVAQLLEKKLRWVTLGGQYDWTQKVYPDTRPPQFPEDVASLLRGVFPLTDPQAAILNFYSPGDTLSLHRDVSEDCDRGLVSLSIGCDAIFLLANFDNTETATIRLRSGDVILMSGPSRYAWHAVPKVLPATCPEALQSWPVSSTDSACTRWYGWLSNKRINLNVRQMKEEAYALDADSPCV